MMLSPFVEIYRKLGKPDLNNNVLRGELPFNGDNIELIENIRRQKIQAFDGLFVDRTEFLDGKQLPDVGRFIEFEIRLPSDSSNRFHHSLEEFINNTPNLSKGEIPKDFYIIDIDYYRKDNISPIEIDKLVNLCNLISKLSELAHYHDSKAATPFLKLVFVQPNSKGSPSTIVIDTKIDFSMLDFAPADLCLLDEITCDIPSNDPHYHAKKDVFGYTITEFIANRPPKNAFSYLAECWKDFILLYQNNLGTYLSGFAFHKAKREIAETELDLAAQFSKVTSDIAGKLLSIPISFAAVIAIVKADSFLEKLLLVIGLLIAAVVIVGAIRNQQFQLKQIKHAKSIKFSSIEVNEEFYPNDLKEAVKNMKININKQSKNLSILLWVYRCISWLPVIAGLVFLLFEYPLSLF